MITVDEARQIILKECKTIGRVSGNTESVSLLNSLGRVLAEQIELDRDHPPFDRSMRDGFAVRDSDVRKAPTTLRIVGEVAAGQTPLIPVQEREAVRIMTGAAVPMGATAVIMVEHTEYADEKNVRVLKTVVKGDNISPKGSERLIHEPVCRPGQRITAAYLAALASVGRTHLKVYRRPSVAVLATGNELVCVENLPGPFQIRNSNSFGLAGQVLRYGGEPTLLQIARDDKEDLHNKISSGLEMDILLVSGGVSMGKYDLVEPVFADLGIRVQFEAVSMRPGKPVVFATWKDKFIFGLPGNPVSTFVTFELFVRPVLAALQSLRFESIPLIRGILEGRVQEKSGRTAFLPAQAYIREHQLLVKLVKWRGSGDLFGLVDANALVVVPRETTALQNGDEVDAYLFEEIAFGIESRF